MLAQWYAGHVLAQTKRIGPYLIERRLATGGMAEVYVAAREGPHGFRKRVALKRILPQLARDQEFVELFVQEARLAAQLDHPNIVSVFDFGEADGELFIAMELVDGTNVHRLLRSAATKGRVPMDVVLHIARQTAQALEYAHRMTDGKGTPLGLVHRDVSPANILLTKTGHVKLADFGIATAAERALHTTSGQVRGKVGYMSPEQVTGKRLDGRSDVFTLAVVLTELLILEPLFGTGQELDILLRIRDVDLEVLNRSDRQIPRDVHTMLMGALARRPDKRFTASQLAAKSRDIAQRRGLAQGPDRLAGLLQRLNLGSSIGARQEPSSGANTRFFDTSALEVETDTLTTAPSVTSPEIYRVRLPDGTEAGPMSFPKLVQLITSGQIHAATMVAKGPAGFAAATGLPELTRFLTSPALQWGPNDLEGAAASGPLGAIRLVPLVYEIVHARRTGVLHLWDGSRRKKIYFVAGKPEFVASTERRELLGEFLVRNEHCLRMEVEMGLALLPRYGGRLGDALVGLGVLRPVELFRHIAAQVHEKLLDAFRWHTGNWAFVPDVHSHEETFPLGIDPYELLRDAVLTADESELVAALRDLDEVVIRRVEPPPERAIAFAPPDVWLRVLNRVRGDSTPKLLVGMMVDGGEEPIDVYRALFWAIQCGFIERAPTATVPD